MRKNTVLSIALTSIALTGVAGCGNAKEGKPTSPNVALKNTDTVKQDRAKDVDKRVSRDEQRKALPKVTASVTYRGEKPVAVKTTEGKTVAEVLKQAKKPVTKTDVVMPKLTDKVSKNTHITVTNQSSNNVTENVTIAQPKTVYKNDSTLQKGVKRTAVKGHAGKKVVSYQVKTINNKNVSKKKINEKITLKPLADTVIVGTKVSVKKTATPVKPTTKKVQLHQASKPTQKVVKKATAPAKTVKSKSYASSAQPTAVAKPKVKKTVVATPKAVSTPKANVNKNTAGLNLSNMDMWTKIAQCESGNNWQIVSANGIYHGGLQFNHAAWAEYGGLKYAPDANLATKEQQIDIANNLYAARGLQPWQCGWAAGR